MFRVLVTDANYKNAIALTRYAKRDITDLFAIGHTTSRGWLAKWNGCFDSVVSGKSLDSIIHSQAYDMVIPVGGLSVLTVAAQSPSNAVLPPLEKLEVSYDKLRTIELADRLRIPAPSTSQVSHPGQAGELSIRFPCVVKPAREASGLKLVSYCGDSAELSSAVAYQLHRLRGKAAVLVQEFINGKGFGLFALMDRGVPLRVFMHQRIREYPPTGGASTAARAFYSERLKDLGLRLLSALQWHGVAMVEFKYSDVIEDFVLIEVNGKFWGSLELALSAGINFGADLIRLYRGEKLSYSEKYDRHHEFYWPLDEDLLTLWKTHSLGRITDYWKSNAHTNLSQSLRTDAVKVLRLAKQMIADPLPSPSLQTPTAFNFAAQRSAMHD